MMTHLFLLRLEELGHLFIRVILGAGVVGCVRSSNCRALRYTPTGESDRALEYTVVARQAIVLRRLARDVRQEQQET
jgi:hypothetical protein